VRRGLVWTLLGFILLAVLSLGATLASGHTVLLGLDLKGGVSVVLAPQKSVDDATLDQAVSIIERRVNGLGVSNAEVQRQGRDVVISLPGIKNSQSALQTLGTTAELYFRPVYCQIADYTRPPATIRPGATPASTTPTSSTPSSTTPGSTTPGSTTAGSAPSTAAPPSTAATATTAKGAVEPPASGRGAQLTSARLDALTSAAAPASTPSAASPAATAPAATTPAATTPAATTPASGTPSITAAPAPAATTPTTVAPNSDATQPQGTTVPVASPGTTAQAQADCAATNAAQIPSTSPDSDIANKPVIVPASSDSGYSGRFILGPADLTGRAVKTAYVSLPQGSSSYAVELTFTSSGSKDFNKMAAVRNKYYSSTATTPNPASLEAIELDGVLESAPQIEQANFNGSAQITGNFTQSQASNLALELKYGSLPVRFTPQSVQTVSATIGKASLRAGLLAGLGGIVVVLLYMIIYYRALGLVVALGLALGGALLYSILTELSQTSSLALTLSGVTGIIVSIGITVDSYVVYFERLKDEIRSGRTVRQSVERSFARAFRTVLTADTVSFLAALILYILTVGDVKGFAFTLGLSTLLDVFTAYFFIRPMVILLGRRRTFTDAPVLGIARGLGAKTGVRTDA
jgi:preprotein translocase subunit SecD